MKKALKKVSSLIIASSMLASVLPLAFAAEADPWNREPVQRDLIEALKAKGIDYEVEDLKEGTGAAKVKLNADTEVKKVKGTVDGADTAVAPEDAVYGDEYVYTLVDRTNRNKEASIVGDFISYLDMDRVREAFEAFKDVAERHVVEQKSTTFGSLLKTVAVTGNFEIKVAYDSNLTLEDGSPLDTSEFVTNVNTMYGFNEEAKEVFIDNSRSVEKNSPKEGYNTLIIKGTVKAPSEKYWGIPRANEKWAGTLLYSDLAEYYETLLGDISFEIPGVKGVKPDSNDSSVYFTESIGMTGDITIGNGLAKIDFSTEQGATGYKDANGNIVEKTEKDGRITKDGFNNYSGIDKDFENISATMGIVVPSGGSATTGGGSSRGSGNSSSPAPVRPTLAPGATLAPGETPNPDASAEPGTEPGTDTVDPNAPSVPGSGTNRPLPNMDPNGNFVPSNHTVPSALNGEDHMVYVIGYPEGDVRPLRSITREEIATIFYRLLTDAKRDSIYTKESPFSDVLKSRWSNKAIATMANGKYILGDAGKTTFRPADAITRAEMAAIVSRFLDTTPEIRDISEDFTDLGGHWAQEAIAQGVAAGWLTGYTDHSFKPDQQITRAEAMTVINRMLVRYVREGGLAEGYVQWPDNPQDAWYYYNVIEATNSHEYNARTFETTDDYYETWPSIITNWIWGDFKTAYEDPDEIDKQ